MPKQYSTTLIIITLALSVIIGVGIILLILAQTPLTCEDRGLPTTCTKHSDCGSSGFYGQTYCKDGNVWQGYYENNCRGDVGTCESYCESSQTERIVQECDNECEQGRCD